MAAGKGLVQNGTATPGCMTGILFGAIIGASCVGLLFATGLNLTWNMKSTDFLSAVLSALGALLGAISVLLAIGGIAIAFFAIYGWGEFKRRTGETAADKAAAVAGPAAIEVAVPAAIKQVDVYLDKNLDPEIRQKVISIVGQIVTPDFLKSLIGAEKVEKSISPELPFDEAQSFSADAVAAAATEEVMRQEVSLDAFDATVEAERMRGDNMRAVDDDE